MSLSLVRATWLSAGHEVEWHGQIRVLIETEALQGNAFSVIFSHAFFFFVLFTIAPF
jgi:hypothetical protein